MELDLAGIDRAGLVAAAAVKKVIGSRELASVEDDDLRERAIEAFAEALGDELRGPTLAMVRGRLLQHHDRLTHDAAAGRLSYGVFLVEAQEKHDAGAGGAADPDQHPTIAYLDRLAKAAGEAAADTYRGELSGHLIEDRISEETYRDASQKALDSFLKTLGEIPAHEVWTKLRRDLTRRVPPVEGWTILLTAGAGVLASLLIAPSAVARVMKAAGVSADIGFDQDFSVIRDARGLSLSIGGAAYILPAALSRGHLWEQTAACFRAEARATAGYGPASLTATVAHGPEGPAWSVMAKLDLASW